MNRRAVLDEAAPSSCTDAQIDATPPVWGLSAWAHHSSQQMPDILGQVKADQPIGAVARTASVAVTTIHRWKAHYSAMTKDETRRFRLLEQENRRLKKLVFVTLANLLAFPT